MINGINPREARWSPLLTHDREYTAEEMWDNKTWGDGTFWNGVNMTGIWLDIIEANMSLVLDSPAGVFIQAGEWSPASTTQQKIDNFVLAHDFNGDGYVNEDDVDLNNDGFIDLLDFTLYLDQYGEYLENWWIFDIADMVIYGWDYNNYGSKLVQVRFYQMDTIDLIGG